MAIIVGSGDYKYRIIEDWAKLPDGWSFKEVGAVGCDKNDNVYVFNRSEHPMMVFDRDGKFLRSWGGRGPVRGPLGRRRVGGWRAGGGARRRARRLCLTRAVCLRDRRPPYT